MSLKKKAVYQAQIRQHLQEKSYRPLKGKELEKRLGIPKENSPLFQQALTELIKNEEVLVQKGHISPIVPPRAVVSGVLRVHPRGFGFLVPDDRASFPLDVFIPRHLTGGAVDGDRVEVLIQEESYSEKGPEGEVLHVVQRGRSHLAGTITHILPENKALAYAPILGSSTPVHLQLGDFSLKAGDRVVIHVSDWGSKQHEPLGEVASYLGHISDAACDVQAAIEEFDLEDVFPKEVEEEAKRFGKQVDISKERKDFRDLVTLTIDPTSAQDFDDALSLSKDNQGHYHLCVHIADVSHYVQPGSHLDKEAKKRCNSVYFPGYVVPMLPKQLSNELCSLKPNVDRLAVSVLMEITPDGELKSSSIVKSVIKSQKRFTYAEAKEVLDGKKQSPFAQNLALMQELCLLLKQKRYERGSIEFAFPEVVVEVNQDGDPQKMVLVEYDITHQLVEEFMLKANEVVATLLAKANKPLTYRIHESPSEENLKEFAYTASLLGFQLSGKPTTEELQKLFDEARGSPFGQFLATSFIKSLRLATYSCENIGHYGLMLDHYTHFTSPIRRYIDIIVHRVLFNEIEHQENLEKIALVCSEKERLSAKAENRVKLLKKLRLLLAAHKKDPHKQFEAVITSVKPFGFTFEISSYILEGFIHVSEIGDDFFEFDPRTKALIGRYENQMFATGDPVHVVLQGVNLITLETHWTLAQSLPPKKPKRRKKRA